MIGPTCKPFPFHLPFHLLTSPLKLSPSILSAPINAPTSKAQLLTNQTKKKKRKPILMGKKMKLPALFKHKEAREPWQWPSCKHPKTLSFRAGDDVFKTVNSVFFEPIDGVETPESWFTKSPESASFSTESDQEFDGESLEMVVRGARSERLFFEPGSDTSSILEEAKTGGLPFKESVVLAMESADPYVDFRKSMEEMVETHGLKDWKILEELLGWYLQVNGKTNHGFIIGAFIDLLVGLNATSCSDSTSYSSAVSSLPSSPLCSTQGDDNEIEEEENVRLP